MIRDATPQDREAVAALWAGCLREHDVAPNPRAFDRAWAAVADARGFGLRVTADAKDVAGFALHSWGLNSWTGETDGCLDTLFVSPEARGRGRARALLDDLLAVAARRGWASVTWHVHGGNAAARALYARYGAPDGYLRHRVTVEEPT